MIFGPIFRALQTFLAYVCPAYCTYKSIEAKKTEAMLDWAMYWFVLAIFSTVERVVDVFLFWLPLYSLAKIALVVYLWYPGTQGAQVVYNKFVKVHLVKYEPKIDEAVKEAKDWGNEMFLKYKDSAFDKIRTHGFGMLTKMQGLSAANKGSKNGGAEEPKKEG